MPVVQGLMPSLANDTEVLAVFGFNQGGSVADLLPIASKV